MPTSPATPDDSPTDIGIGRLDADRAVPPGVPGLPTETRTCFISGMSRVLSAPLQVAFPYTRSLGGVLGAFMTGLRDGRVLGARVSDGRVVVPPVEFDPVTHAPVEVSDLVEVGTQGVVETWTWVTEPVAAQPFDRPFAWALIRLDGADTPMLHAVDADGPEAMSTGMRVQVVWKDDPRRRHHRHLPLHPSERPGRGCRAARSLDGGRGGRWSRGAGGGRGWDWPPRSDEGAKGVVGRPRFLGDARRRGRPSKPPRDSTP